jgi:hypothetical protein
VAHGHAWAGRVRAPVEPGAVVDLPGLPPLQSEALSWFLRVGPGPYPTYFEMVLGQFQGLEQADDVLVNSVYELEPEVSSRATDRCGVLAHARRHRISNILLIRTRSHSASLLPVSRYLLSFYDQFPII